MHATIALVDLVFNTLLIVALLIWWSVGTRRARARGAARWKWLPVYYAAIIAVIVEATVLGVVALAITGG